MCTYAHCAHAATKSPARLIVRGSSVEYGCEDRLGWHPHLAAIGEDVLADQHRGTNSSLPATVIRWHEWEQDFGDQQVCNRLPTNQFAAHSLPSPLFFLGRAPVVSTTIGPMNRKWPRQRAPRFFLHYSLSQNEVADESSKFKWPCGRS